MNANIYIFSLLLDFVSASHEIPAGTWRQETLFLTHLNKYSEGWTDRSQTTILSSCSKGSAGATPIGPFPLA